MANAKLWPLSFDEALKKLIDAPPARKSDKPKKSDQQSNPAKGNNEQGVAP